MKQGTDRRAIIVLLLACGTAMCLVSATARGGDTADDGHQPAGRTAEAGHDEHDEHDEHGGAHAAHDDGHDEHGAAHAAHDDDGHDGHEEHGAAHAAHEDGHEGHDEEVDAHAGHDHGAAEGPQLVLDRRTIKRAGIEMDEARSGALTTVLHLPGEIVVNADRMAHIVPPAAGIVRDVRVSLGDRVEAGEVLAVVESAALGAAKVAYLTTLNELGCCTVELARAETIAANTTALLALMDGAPSLEALRQAEIGQTGVYRSRLVSAYAETMLTRQVYERERRLAEQAIGSRSDLQVAETAYKKAQATYLAERDSIAYDVQRELLEQQRSRRDNGFALSAAERNLHVLGVTDHEVQDLAAVVPGGGGPAATHACDDPNCADCARRRSEAGGTPVHGQADAEEAHVCTDPDCADCAHERGETEAAHAHADGAHVCTDPDCADCARERGETEAAHAHADGAHVCADPDCADCAHERGEAEAAHAHADEAHVCTDPDCADCAHERGEAGTAEALPRDHGGRNTLAHLGFYALRAPFAGTIIQRHLTLGEKVGHDEAVLTIADLSTVWVELSAYPRDLPHLRVGQAVEIVGEGSSATTGRIDYVAPIIDPRTRAASVRVALPNHDGRWRPGLYVKARAVTEGGRATVILPREAVQRMADEPVVFVPVDGGFATRPVRLGRAADGRVEVLGGLEPGDRFVVKGAFELKAAMVTSGMDPHAGHGH